MPKRISTGRCISSTRRRLIPAGGTPRLPARLTIDPGSRTLSGPNQRKLFDTGTIDFADADPVIVPLGEIRSDDANHLLVLGGLGKSASPPGSGLSDYWINDDWYDDVSDGPVSATITIRATNTSPPVVGAWIIVAPPKFAPDIDNVITLVRPGVPGDGRRGTAH